MRDPIALSMLDIARKLNDKTSGSPYNPPELFYNVCTTETCKKFSLLEQEDARSLLIYILAHWAEGEQSWKISELYQGHLFSKSAVPSVVIPRGMWKFATRIIIYSPEELRRQ